MKTDISLHPAQGCWEHGRGYNLSGLTLRNCEARCAVSAMSREAGTHTEMALCSEDGTHCHEDPAAPLSGDFQLGQPHIDNNSLSAASWTRMSLPLRHSSLRRRGGDCQELYSFIPAREPSPNHSHLHTLHMVCFQLYHWSLSPASFYGHHCG